MSATYAFRSSSGDIERMSPFGKPPPPHTMTPAAEAGRESIRAFARRRTLERIAADLVTDHGNPHVEPYVPAPRAVRKYRKTKSGKRKLESVTYVDGAVRPAAALALAARAEKAGWKTNVFTTHLHVRTVVEGVRGGEAFRAVWLRGGAESGTWHERQWRYAVVEDLRPVGVAKITRTALAGKRGAGIGTTRLAIVASPWGIAVGVSEISKRVSAT